MKKVLKIVGICLLVLVLLIAAGVGYIIYKLATSDPEIMAPEDYETSVAAGGDIEQKYLSHGSHDVAYFEEETDEAWAKYEVYYPSDMESSDEQYPVIVMSNGSGVRASRYTAVFEHYASWGFVVIGNEHDTSYAGDSSDGCLAYLIEANDNPDSVFYQKIDFDNVGIVGHSQGGGGAFNAVTSQTHGDIYKTVVALSPVGEETAKALNWTYEPTEITIPVMVLIGTNNDCISVEQLQSLYANLASTEKVMAVRSDTSHPEMLYSADGYVTAWFMWQLQGDEEAAKAFVGDEAELLSNDLYQDVQIDIE